MEPKKGQWGLWYINGVSAGFATKEKAEEHVRVKNAAAVSAAAVEKAEANTAAIRSKDSKKFLGYGAGEWIFSAVLGATFLWVFMFTDFFDRSSGEPRAERASTAEIMQCKARIEREFAGTIFTVDTKPIIGTSSDKLGPAGTSRVKMHFDLVSPGGGTVSRVAVCQYTPDAPPLVVSQ